MSTDFSGSSFEKKTENWIEKKIKSLSPVQVIVYSFAFVIALGTCLLLLPISTKNPGQNDFVTAIFTAVSCTCVTGLSLHDTWSYFSFFGQAVMLLLIQIGGLGLVSFTSGFTLIVNRRLGLRDMKIMQEGTQGNLVDIPQLIKTIFITTFLVEMLGTSLLCLKFIPNYGLNGLWLAVFLSVSSYCNAGFDVAGFILPNSSVMNFNDDPFVLGVLSTLIITGGLGFFVVIDLYRMIKRIIGIKSINKISLQTKVVFKSTIWLLLIGAVLFFCFEYENTLKGLSIWNKISTCFFHSASSRTAGFFAFDLASQYDITKFITIILMFIGASPGSTGGGIKTVSFIVIMSAMWGTLCGKEDAVIFGRKINKTFVYRSFAISTAFIMLIVMGTFMVSMLEARKPIAMLDILYEVVSAISTTGLSTGITKSLSNFSKFLLMMYMFAGRVGPISLILALVTKKGSDKHKTLPEGKFIIG